MELWFFIVLCLLPFVGFKVALIVGAFFSDANIFTLATYAFLLSMMLGLVLFLLSDVWISRLVRKKRGGHWQNKIERRANAVVRKYGILSLSVFIALPTVNSGNYASAIFARVLGYRAHDYVKGLILGSAVYCVVMSISLSIILRFV